MAKTMAEWKIGDPMINANDYWQDPNYKAPDPEKEKLVLKLATLITDRYVKKLTKQINNRDPEYWMLDRVLNKQQVRFCLNFKKTRVPYSIPELAKMNNMTEEECTKMVERLRWIGIIEQNRAKTPDKHLQYELPIFVPGSAEFMMMQGKLTDEFPQLATFFNLMTQLPLAGITQMVPPGGAGIGMHVIPVEKAISLENKSVPVCTTSTESQSAPAVSSRPCEVRAQVRSEVTTVSVWAIWPSIWMTAVSDITSPKRKFMRFWREQSVTAMFTRSPILTERARS